jgi:hypothetical protein
VSINRSSDRKSAARLTCNKLNLLLAVSNSLGDQR